MDDDFHASPVPDPQAADRSLIEDIKQLAQDGRTLLDAEIAFQTSRARIVGQGVGVTIGYVAIAAVLAVLALVGLTVGLIIALAPLLTAWGATAAVVGVLLLVAAVLVWLALSRWKRMTRVLSGKGAGR